MYIYVYQIRSERLTGLSTNSQPNSVTRTDDISEDAILPWPAKSADTKQHVDLHADGSTDAAIP